MTQQGTGQGAGVTRARQRDMAGARRRFLDHLARTGNVSAAARAAGYSRHTLYAWRRQDAEFAETWNDAVIEAVDALEQEARRRAVEGIEQPLVHGGKFVRHEDGSIATIRQYSDRLLEFLLKALRPERFRPETAKGQVAETNPEVEAGDDEASRDGGGPLSEDERAERVARLLDGARARGARPVAEGDSDATEAEGLDAAAGATIPSL
jgi:hypothetical protein